MRIAQITATFLPTVGGVEWKVHYLSQEYSRRGHDVTVFAVRPPAGLVDVSFNERPAYRLVRSGIQARGAGRLGLNGWLIRRAILREHCARPFDVLQCHQLGDATEWGSRLRRKAGIPVVATTSGDDVYLEPSMKYGIRYQSRYDRMVRSNVRSVDVIGSVSRGIRAELEAMGTTARIVDIPNGVPWDDFQTGLSSMLRDRLGLSDETVVVLSVGRNFSLKRYDLGIEAFARAIRDLESVATDKRGMGLQAHYVLIGRDLASLEPLIARLGVQAHVSLVNQMPISELPQAYHSADVFFNPSELEGFAQVNAQALACGLPCVITDARGNVDAGEHGGALIAKCNDVDSMATCLRALMVSHETRKKLGATAHLASRRYAWSQVASEYLDLFASLKADANRQAASSASLKGHATRAAN